MLQPQEELYSFVTPLHTCTTNVREGLEPGVLTDPYAREGERERDYSHFGSSVCTFVVGGLCCPLDLGGGFPG